MTVINVIAALCGISLLWLIYLAFTAKEQAEDEREDIEIVKVEDTEKAGNTIYDLFPEWKKEFENDPSMSEMKANWNLYLAAKEVLKYGHTDVKRIVQLSDAVEKFEKHTLLFTYI